MKKAKKYKMNRLDFMVKIMNCYVCTEDFSLQ